MTSEERLKIRLMLLTIIDKFPNTKPEELKEIIKTELDLML